MKKALGSWGGMRKYLEKEMLATILQGRVRFNCHILGHTFATRLVECECNIKTVQDVMSTAIFKPLSPSMRIAPWRRNRSPLTVWNEQTRKMV